MTDLHLHSTFSDGKLTIPEIVDLYGSHGFGAIAVTDHLCESETWLGKAAAYLGRTLTPATFPIYQGVLRTERVRAWEKYRMVLIPGFEITKNTLSNHRSAHVLGLGCTEWIDASLPIEEICWAIRAQGGLAIAAHPVSTGKLEKQTLHLWSRREELASHFDAWEVASGRKIFDEVLRSGLPMVASSDLHRRDHFSSWKTVVDVAFPRFAVQNSVAEAMVPEAALREAAEVEKEIFAAVREQRLKFTYFQEQESSGRDSVASRFRDGNSVCGLPLLGARGCPLPL